MNGYEHYTSKNWISPSSANSFSRCRRLYFYRSGCRLELPGKRAPLVFGGCIHRALPYAFQGDIERAVVEFCKDWGEELQDSKRNVLRAQAMLVSFYECHRDGKSIYIPITAPEGRLKTEEHNSEYEVPFAVDIGLDIPLVGLVDCLSRHRDTGKIWIVEYKTSSQLGAMFLQAFDLSPQVLTYALAIKTLINEEIEGVFVEGLLVAKVSCNTIPIPIYIKDFYLEDILNWIKGVHNGIRNCEKNKDFPKDLSGCNSYSMFGMPGYTCPYAPLCSTTDNWSDLIEMYEVGEIKETPF